MCYRSLSVFLLASIGAAGALAGQVIDVPGAQAVQAAIQVSTPRDQFARTAVTAAILASVVYAQAGDRAKTKAFTPAESARLAELNGLADAAERNNEATLPAACQGRDCEERFAYNRCYSAYRFLPEFHRAVFDRFFTPAQQETLAPALANAGSLWQDALTMPPNTQPFDQFPAPSSECTTSAAGPAAQTAGAAQGGHAPAAGQTPSATPTIAFDTHADSLQRARAAGVDVTVFGLTLGEPLQLPLCPDHPLLDMNWTPPTTCIANNDSEGEAVIDLVNRISGVLPQVGRQEPPLVSFYTRVRMPPAKCPDWMAGCAFGLALVAGRPVAVSVDTAGLKFQDEIASALVEKYKAATSSGWKEWTNDAGNKLNGREMVWRLPGLTVEFEGYIGGSTDGLGTLIIETDAITRARSDRERSAQAAKQKL